MVVLEPSCWAALRDELVNLMPNDEDAKRLRDLTHTLGEFLDQRVPDYEPPNLPRRVLLHGHCHQKSIEEIGDREFGKLHGEKNVLQKMGVDLDAPATGCCGMAGAFGFENGEHYGTSMKVGENVLLPAVRQAAADTVILADGFSCREQIEQGTDRQAMHLAQVIQYAKRGATSAGRPEAAMVARKNGEHRRAAARVGLTTAAIALVVAVVFATLKADRKRQKA